MLGRHFTRRLTVQRKRVDILEVVAAGHELLAEADGVLALGGAIEVLERVLRDALEQSASARSGKQALSGRDAHAWGSRSRSPVQQRGEREQQRVERGRRRTLMPTFCGRAMVKRACVVVGEGKERVESASQMRCDVVVRARRARCSPASRSLECARSSEFFSRAGVMRRTLAACLPRLTPARRARRAPAPPATRRIGRTRPRHIRCRPAPLDCPPALPLLKAHVGPTGAAPPPGRQNAPSALDSRSRKRSCGTLHPGPPAAVAAPGVGTECSPRRTPWARLVVKARDADGAGLSRFA